LADVVNAVSENRVRPRSTLLVVLFLGALTLRPQLVAIGPLLPQIRHDLRISHSVAGLLGTIPLLCMGVFAPSAPYLSRRLGSRGSIAVAVALLGAFGVARAEAPGALAVILLTVPVGMAIGLAGALMPVVVKERFADRPAFATGVYATGITAGAAASSAVAVPVSHALGGWRGTLDLFGLGSLALAACWLVLTRRKPRPARSRIHPPRLPFRRGVVWILALVFALNSSVFYAVNAWLPDYYVERGWDQGRAGALVAVMSATGIPAGLIVPWFADRLGPRRFYLVANSGLMLAGLLGILLAPSYAWGWTALLGVGTGALFPLLLTLPLDAAELPAEVGAVGGLMLGAGYLLSATSPFLLGAIRDSTGSFRGGLAALAGGVALMLVISSFLTAARLRGAPRTRTGAAAGQG
jgi:MFS transporter, CP family, cyanate transporter